MDMEEYLAATRHASSTLIAAYTKEWQEHKNAAETYNQHVSKFDDVERKQIEQELGGEALRSFDALKALADAWHGLPQKYAALRLYQDDRLAKVPSTSVLCGGLLQIAKAGLSIVHNAPANWPSGRSIAGEAISNIIRAARNQAMHFDEGNYNAQVMTCFVSLAATYGPRLDLAMHPGENLSIHVIDALGWYSLEDYEKDMRSLA